MRKQLAILLLSCLSSLLSAQTVWEDDITCGKQVQVTATPKPGYHFEQWSDGVTDNPRWIDLVADSAIVAYFAPNCRQPQLPVQALYDWMLMLDHAAIKEQGFEVPEEEVYWYRVVKEQDPIGATKRTDELVHVGYYLTLSQAGSPDDWYYAEIHVNAPDTFLLCSDTIRSDTWKFNGTHAVANFTADRLVCYYAAGQVRLSGLPSEATDITLLDMAGRCIARYRSDEYEFAFPAPPEGYYIIQIATRSGTAGIRYIQY